MPSKHYRRYNRNCYGKCFFPQSRYLAYRLINDGYIKALKIGNSFRIPKVNIIDFIMDQNKNSNL